MNLNPLTDWYLVEVSQIILRFVRMKILRLIHHHASGNETINWDVLVALALLMDLGHQS